MVTWLSGTHTGHVSPRGEQVSATASTSWLLLKLAFLFLCSSTAQFRASSHSFLSLRFLKTF